LNDGCVVSVNQGGYVATMSTATVPKKPIIHRLSSVREEEMKLASFFGGE